MSGSRCLRGNVSPAIYFSLKTLCAAIKANSEKTAELYKVLNQDSAYMNGHFRLSLGFRARPNQSGFPPILRLRDARDKRRGENRCVSVTLIKEFGERERDRSLYDLHYRQLLFSFFLFFAPFFP